MGFDDHMVDAESGAIAEMMIDKLYDIGLISQDKREAMKAYVQQQVEKQHNRHS